MGKAVGLNDVLSLRMLEERIKDNSAKFQEQISEKLAELERVKLLKIVKPIANKFIKRKSLMAEMRLLMKAKVRTEENRARMQSIGEELRKMDESV